MSKTRRKQECVYLNDDSLNVLDKLQARYPMRARSAFVNAALKIYWEHAQHGLDGNLDPMAAAGTNIGIDRLSEIARVVQQVLEQRDRLR
jgi:hypothetical protein